MSSGVSNSGDLTPEKQYQIALEGARDQYKGNFFFLKKEHPVAVLTGTLMRGADKVIKMAVAIIDLVLELFKLFENLSKEVVKGFVGLKEVFSNFRTVITLFIAFGDTPARIKYSVHKIHFLVCKLRGIELDPGQKAFCKILEANNGRGYETTAQIIMGIIVESLRIVNSCVVFVSFALLRPLNVLAKLFHFGENAKAIGAKFSLFMMANHILEGVSSLIDMARESIYYHNYQTGTNPVKDAKKYIRFLDAMKDGILNVVKNLGCELGNDIINFFKEVVPVMISVILNLVIAAIDLYRAIKEATLFSESKEKGFNEKFEKAYNKSFPKEDFIKKGLKQAALGLGVVPKEA